MHLPKTSQTRSKKEGLWVSVINSKVKSRNIQLKILIICPGGRNGFVVATRMFTAGMAFSAILY